MNPSTNISSPALLTTRQRWLALRDLYIQDHTTTNANLEKLNGVIKKYDVLLKTAPASDRRSLLSERRMLVNLRTTMQLHLSDVEGFVAKVTGDLAWLDGQIALAA